MVKVSNQLDSICECLFSIERRLVECQAIERRYSTQKEEERKKKTAERLIGKAKELIEACNNYKTLNHQKRDDMMAIQTGF